MRRTRVIPTLLLKNEGLYKTLKFRDPKYIGDPINTAKLFSEKEADELFLLDITASSERKAPNFAKIAEVASEAFVPVGYGGGIRTIEDIRRILKTGIEKVVINTASVDNPNLVREAARVFGSQSIVVSIDVKRTLFGNYVVYVSGGSRKTDLEPVDWARRAESFGAGELLLNAIDRDGTLRGYDLQLVKSVATAVRIPVVACGGAASIEDFAQAVTQGGASAVAAGSMFVFQKSRNAVLISFPSQEELVTRLYRRT